MGSGPVSPLVFLIAPGILIIVGVAIWLVISNIKNKGENTVENRNAIISTILFIVGGLPLLIYPAILIANMMSLAGERTGESEPLLLGFVWYAFLAVSSAYPLTYLVSLIIYQQRKKLLYAFAPLIHIGVALLLVFFFCCFAKD